MIAENHKERETEQGVNKSEFARLGPLSGSFIINQRLKILAWDDLGSIKLSNWLFGVEQYWPEGGLLRPG